MKFALIFLFSAACLVGQGHGKGKSIVEECHRCWTDKWEDCPSGRIKDCDWDSTCIAAAGFREGRYFYYRGCQKGGKCEDFKRDETDYKDKTASFWCKTCSTERCNDWDIPKAYRLPDPNDTD